jgi:hypothetical protein
MRPCQALGCGCIDYARGERVGMYDQCAACGHTDQVHAKAPAPSKVKVKA